MKAEYDAKVEKLDHQIAKASQEFKSKLEKTRDDLQADYEKRSEKLKQAGDLVSEALS